MIISDLSYLETVSETSSVLGASGYHKKSKMHGMKKRTTPSTPTYVKKPVAIAVNVAVVKQTAIAINGGSGTAVAVNSAIVGQSSNAVTK